MKRNVLSAKATIITMILVFSMSLASLAASYTATTSGNWSSSITWGGTAPGFSITGADDITVPLGVTVTLDNNLTINNAGASLTVAGTLTGANDLSLTAGTLTGTLAGAVTVNTLTVGAAGLITSLGPINVTQFANSQATLALATAVHVSNTIVLNAGMVQLNTGGVINLAANGTLNMAGGTYSVIGGGLLTLAGSFNLLYSGAVTTVGAEAALIGLQNVTVNLATASSQLNLATNLTVAGTLSLQQGYLVLNGNTLTLNGGINTASTGSITGSSTSNIIVNGTGSVGTLGLTAGAGAQSLNNLTVNIASGGSISLATNVVVGGILTLTGSSLNLNGHNLTIGGTVIATVAGAITGSGTSGITVNGSGIVGTLMFSPSGNTLGSLAVNITGTGSVLLGTDLTVSGALALSSGSLNLNGHNLTIGGNIATSGSGTIGGNIMSDITFNGTGNAGTFAFTAGSETIKNLTINIGSTGSVALGSAATIGGTLTLAQGNIHIGNNDLTISGIGSSLSGGSSASYVVTDGTGSLVMAVANAGANGVFQVGTTTAFAPVTITNNSTLGGNFNVNSHHGIFTGGTTGNDLSVAGSVVNTSWNVSSSIVTGANVNLEMFWNTAMQVNGFDNTQAFVSHYTGGAWDTSAVAAAAAHGAGAYSLSLTGVTSFSPFAVFDKNTTAAIENVTTAAFQLYPNPATDVLRISVPEMAQYQVLKISNAIGSELFSQAITNTLTSVDISGFAPGIYFASFNNTVSKFIKQ